MGKDQDLLTKLQKNIYNLASKTEQVECVSCLGERQVVVQGFSSPKKLSTFIEPLYENVMCGK